MSWWRVGVVQPREMIIEVEADTEEAAREQALNEAEDTFASAAICWDLIEPEVTAIERMER